TPRARVVPLSAWRTRPLGGRRGPANLCPRARRAQCVLQGHRPAHPLVPAEEPQHPDGVRHPARRPHRGRRLPPGTMRMRAAGAITAGYAPVTVSFCAHELFELISGAIEPPL